MKKLKTLVISDTHSQHKIWEKKFPFPEGIDLIIHGGDLTNIGLIGEFNDFVNWFNNLPVEHKIMIAGNHDLGLDDPKRRYTIMGIIQGTDIHYLEDSGVEIEGIKFWGSPVTPPFMDWAFMREPERIRKHWEGMPDDIDVLITHGPPHGTLDLVEDRWSPSDGTRVGCKELVDALERVRPKYHIFGHIHNQYGMVEKDGTTYLNASVLDGHYYVKRLGHIIELEK